MAFLWFTLGMRAFFVVMMTWCLVSPLWGGSQVNNKALLSWHLETEASDNPKMIFAQMTAGKTRYFRRVPEISTKDVVAFAPFPSDAGGDDYGIVFKLNDNATRRLAAISNVNQGRWLLTQMNGRVVDGVMIDKQIDDGYLVVWKGGTLADIKVFDASLQRINRPEGKRKD